MANAQVQQLAYAVYEQIRVHGHLTDVDDPTQRGRHNIITGAYGDAPRKVRKAFVQELNRRLKVEKREQHKDDFGPLAALIAWNCRTPTEVVLETLDSIAS
jgi:hypothetical protein